MESVNAWFTAFTTIGFGDYIHLDSFKRRAVRGEIPGYRVMLYGFISSFPYIMGLSLVSCILNCLLDSVENVGISVIGVKIPPKFASAFAKIPLSRAIRL